MPQGKPRDPRKEQHWRQLIDQWQRSGLSVCDFCKRQHLAVPTFYAWRRRLQQGDGLARLATPAVTFLPVHVRPDDAPPPLELALADGRYLRIPHAFDAAHLRQVLRALEDPSC